MNKITNEDYEAALNNIDYIKIMKFASRPYQKAIPPDDLYELKLVTLWESLLKYDISLNTKFTTFLHQQIRFKCLKYISKTNAEKRRNTKHLEGLTGLTKHREGYLITNADSLDIMIRDLEEEHRLILKQKYLDRLTLEEIGQYNGYCKETARKRLKDAIKAFAELVK